MGRGEVQDKSSCWGHPVVNPCLVFPLVAKMVGNLPLELIPGSRAPGALERAKVPERSLCTQHSYSPSAGRERGLLNNPVDTKVC